MTTNSEKFIRGNERLNKMLADPQTRRDVNEARAEMAQADRQYRTDLAAIRQAANLTQVELAERMKIKQSSVSGLESRDDLLLSTLASYLEAVGATGTKIVATIAGREVELEVRTVKTTGSRAARH